MNFDHYVYPGTNILKNRQGITDKQMAYDFERTFSSKRIGVLRKQGITGKFDTTHLKAIHKFVFGDIYDWAGEFRDIQIFKGLTEFTAPENIQSELDVLCADIRDKNYFRGLSKYAAADGLADAMCRLNQIHPFREGNGRTQRLFMEQMALNAGYNLDFSQVSENAMRNASFFASVRGDSRPMQCLFAFTFMCPLSDAIRTRVAGFCNPRSCFIDTSPVPRPGWWPCRRTGCACGRFLAARGPGPAAYGSPF